VTATGDRPDRGLDAATVHDLSQPRPATARVAHRDAEPPGGLDLLRQMVEAACAALDQAADLSSDVRIRQQRLHIAEQHLDQAGRPLERGRQELATVAAEIARASLPQGACGVPWPVCAQRLGVGLRCSGGSSCCPACGRSGGSVAARPAYLCTERATVRVRDATATEQAMCLSHAAAALRRIDQLTIVDATDEEVRRLATARDRPLAVNLTRPITHMHEQTALDRS